LARKTFEDEAFREDPELNGDSSELSAWGKLGGRPKKGEARGTKKG
jgi:hypothetical protein